MNVSHLHGSMRPPADRTGLNARCCRPAGAPSGPPEPPAAACPLSVVFIPADLQGAGTTFGWTLDDDGSGQTVSATPDVALHMEEFGYTVGSFVGSNMTELQVGLLVGGPFPLPQTVNVTDDQGQRIISAPLTGPNWSVIEVPGVMLEPGRRYRIEICAGAPA